MRSQLEEGTDDEYFDDPIKLFDREEDRVHFGIQPYQYGLARDDTFSQSIANVTDIRDAEHEESSDDGEYLSVSVKLVDCKKYPWYFKKYASQIINKANIYDLVSDSDDERDMEKNSGDSVCIVLNDNIDYTTIGLSKTSPSMTHKIAAAKRRQENMRRREDFELQLALSRKCLDIVDYKRNKGLIGMTIKQKCEKDLDTIVYQTIKEKGITIKPNETLVDKAYMKAANETLNSCGTEVIPITTDIERTVVTKVNISNDKNNHEEIKEKAVKGLNKQNVQFSFGKMSENLVNHIFRNKFQEKNNLNNSLNKWVNQKPCQYKTKCFSDHIINIKKTNKYKRRQRKQRKRENMLLKMKNAQVVNEKINKNDENYPNVNINRDQTQQKVVEYNSEPLSPILPCGVIKKNRDILDVSFKQDMTNMVSNIIQDKESQKANDNSIPNGSHNKQLNQIINKDHSLNMQPDLQLQQYENKHGNKVDMNTKEACDKDGKDCAPTHLLYSNVINKIPGDLTPTTQDGSSDMQLKIVSVVSIANSTKLTNASNYTVDKNLVSGTLENSQSNTIAITNNTNIRTELNNDTNSSLKHVSVNNDRVNTSNNTNMAIDNPCLSEILLKPNQSNNCQSTQFNQSIFNGQNFSKMLAPASPRSFSNSYSVNYHPPPYAGIHQRFTPRFANGASQNYRFPPPHEYRCESQYNPVQVPPCDWQHPNTYHKKAAKSVRSRKIYPYHMPSTVSQIPPSCISDFDTPLQLSNVSHPNNILPSTSIPQTQNEARPEYGSVIGKNNAIWVKNGNEDPTSLIQTQDKQTVTSNNRVSEPNNGDLQIVTSKTEMAEVLDNAARNLKRRLSENNATEMKKVTPQKIKRLSINPPAFIENDHQQQIEQRKGYSPPILPIPTYEKIMGDIKCSSHIQNGPMQQNTTNNHTQDKFIFNERVSSHKPHSTVKREDPKKISLEEYKKRILKMDAENKQTLKKLCRYNNNNRKQPNKLKGNVGRFSTESDLGYDSDSTVIL